MNPSPFRRRFFLPVTEGLVILTAVIAALYYVHQSYLLEKVSEGLLDFADYARAVNTTLLAMVVIMVAVAELIALLSWVYLRRAERSSDAVTGELPTGTSG